MINKKLINKYILLLPIALLVLFSCQPLLVPPSETGDNEAGAGNGNSPTVMHLTFRLSSDFSVSARTLTPGTEGFQALYSKYHLKIEPQTGGAALFDQDITVEANGDIETDITTLTPGVKYKATVSGYVDDPNSTDDIIAAEGSADFTAITDGGSVSIKLKPIPPNVTAGGQRAKGFFNYSIKLPAGQGYTAKVSLKGPRAQGVWTDAGEEVLVGEGYDYRTVAATDTVQTIDHNLALDEGIYDFTFIVSRIVGEDEDTKTTILASETCYIYPGLLTTYAPEDFSIADINIVSKEIITGKIDIVNAQKLNNSGNMVNYALGDIYIVAYMNQDGIYETKTFDKDEKDNDGSYNGTTDDDDTNVLGWASTASGETKRDGFRNAVFVNNTSSSDTESSETVSINYSIVIQDTSVLLSSNKKVYIKAFSTATTAGGAGSSSIYLQSDHNYATSLTSANWNLGEPINISYTDRVISPPELLQYSIYSTSSNKLNLIFNQEVKISSHSYFTLYESDGGSGYQPYLINANAAITDADSISPNGDYAYLWELSLGASVPQGKKLWLGWSNSAAQNAYGLYLKAETVDTTEGTGGKEVNNSGAQGAPKLIARYIEPSSTIYGAGEDKRIGDTLTLVFDQAVVMPGEIDASDLGFTLTGGVAGSTAPINNKSLYSDVGESRSLPNDFSGVPKDINGANAAAEIASNVWKLKLNTLLAGDQTRYADKFVVASDTLKLMYEKQAMYPISTGATGAIPLANFGLGSVTDLPVLIDIRLNTGDWTAPTIIEASISDNDTDSLSLSFSEGVTVDGGTNKNASTTGFGLDVDSGDYDGDFVDGTDSLASSFIPSSRWTLNLDEAMDADDDINITYYGTKVYDNAGNYLAEIEADDKPIDNRISPPPLISSAVIFNDDPLKMFVTFDQPVNIPPTANAVSAYTVQINGAGPWTAIDSVTSQLGYTIWEFTMSNPVHNGEAVSLKYEKGAPADQTEADATPYTAMEEQTVSVANRVEAPVVGDAIAVTSAVLNVKSGDDAYITVVFSKPVNIPAAAMANFKIKTLSGDWASASQELTINRPTDSNAYSRSWLFNADDWGSGIYDPLCMKYDSGLSDADVTDANGVVLPDDDYIGVTNNFTNDNFVPRLAAASIEDSDGDGKWSTLFFYFTEPMKGLTAAGWTLHKNSESTGLTLDNHTAMGGSPSNIWSLSFPEDKAAKLGDIFTLDYNDGPGAVTDTATPSAIPLDGFTGFAVDNTLPATIVLDVPANDPSVVRGKDINITASGTVADAGKNINWSLKTAADGIVSNTNTSHPDDNNKVLKVSPLASENNTALVVTASATVDGKTVRASKVIAVRNYKVKVGPPQLLEEYDEGDSDSFSEKIGTAFVAGTAAPASGTTEIYAMNSQKVTLESTTLEHYAFYGWSTEADTNVEVQPTVTLQELSNDNTYLYPVFGVAVAEVYEAFYDPLGGTNPSLLEQNSLGTYSSLSEAYKAAELVEPSMIKVQTSMGPMFQQAKVEVRLYKNTVLQKDINISKNINLIAYPRGGSNIVNIHLGLASSINFNLPIAGEMHIDTEADTEASKHILAITAAPEQLTGIGKSMIKLTNGKLYLDGHVVITGRNQDRGSGVGIRVENTSTLVMDATTILIMNDGAIYGNKTPINGGGVYVQGDIQAPSHKSELRFYGGYIAGGQGASSADGYDENGVPANISASGNAIYTQEYGKVSGTTSNLGYPTSGTNSGGEYASTWDHPIGTRPDWLTNGVLAAIQALIEAH
ncbi:MAG: hypothetical protein LBM77_06490 [Spirochaetaceae bacterium]|nr:hypothetical protein [Spirochaetaceae bacterium]